MGLRSLFKKGEEKFKEYQAAKASVSGSTTATTVSKSDPPTRWEKAVLGLNGIVNQVIKIDPNGVDVVCFSGSEVETYRNLKDTANVEDLVTAKEPSGSCNMTQALDVVFTEALERGFDSSTSVVVFTAGKPEDDGAVIESIQNFAKNLEKEEDFSMTFVQVGDSQSGSEFLTKLDDELDCFNAAGEKIDIVDYVKDEDIKKAMGELKEGKGGKGALIGGLAGAALGAGGMYFYNRQQAKKRTVGWNGQWKVIHDGEELAVVNVEDDMEGNLAINDGTTGTYTESEEEYSIMRYNENSFEPIYGTVEDEHNISWSDGTRWEEVDGQDWTSIAAAGAAGAAVGGGMGYVMHKKFFKKAGDKEPSEYVIVMDRSDNMNAIDRGD